MRAATKAFLIKELKLVKNVGKIEKVEVPEFDDENFVRIPIKPKNENEPVREFKQYKILRKLY